MWEEGVTRMRRYFAFFVAVGFAALLALSGSLCLIDSFGLDCGLKALIIGLLALSCWYGLAMRAKKGWITALMCFAPLVLLLSSSLRGELVASFCGLGYDILSQLGGFYPVAVPWAENAQLLASDDLLWALLVLGAAVILPCQWATLGCGPVGPAFALALLMLAPCLFVVDMVPALGYLLLFIGCLCMLALTRSRFLREPRQGAGLVLRLAIPLALLLILLAMISPPETYDRPQWPDDMRESLNWMLEKALARAQGGEVTEELIPGLTVDTAVGLAELETYDLSVLGPRRTTGRKVMEVRAQGQESLYLKGAAYGRYTDNSWSAADAETYPTSFSAPMTSGRADEAETVEVRTVTTQPLMYLPYYLSELPQGGESLRDVYVGNVDETDEYTAYRSQEPKDGYWNDAYERYVYQEYLQVPEDMEPQLWDVLASSDVLAVNATQAVIQGIVGYVQSQAVYDLNTPAVPEGEDFALWFLQSSHQGYCVHFATACCLLMRTAGIPTRYVTGYLAQADSGDWSSVTDDRAHAWVECYISGSGWIPVECTPAAALEEQLSGGQIQTTPEPVEQPQTATPEPEPAETPEPSDQPESTPEPSAQPSAEAAKPTATGKAKKASPLLWLLLIPLLAAAVALRRWLTLRLWDKRYLRAGYNVRARLMWRRISAALRILKEEPPADQEDIVLKARFSQHQLTDQELDQLEQLWAGLCSRLSKRGVGHDLVYKYVLVLY